MSLLNVALIEMQKEMAVEAIEEKEQVDEEIENGNEGADKDLDTDEKDN